MKANEEQRQRSHTDWVSSLHDARSRCRNALVQASVDVSDPDRALWPGVPREEMTREHQTVAKAHAWVLDYAEHVEPFQNRCPKKWTEDFDRPHEFPNGEQLELALCDIEEWSDIRYQIEVGDKHELTGNKQSTEYRRVHMPTGAARKAFRQLNACLEKLNLAADPPTPERTVDSPEEAW